MAYSMYGRGNFYDMRNLPYQNGYYGYRQQQRVLNRRFKKDSVQVCDCIKFEVSVQSAKGRLYQLVLTAIDENDSSSRSVGIPEPLVLQFVQQLQRLLKWRPPASGGPLPSSQSFAFEDTVYRAQVVAEGSPEKRAYMVEIVAEARAKDPQDRRELSSAAIPMPQSGLPSDTVARLRDLLSEATAMDWPLYHTRTQQCSDGSRMYLDLIRCDPSHYLKISQVTRDYRSILHVPAEDLEALVGQLQLSLEAMKQQQREEEDEEEEEKQKQKATKKKRRQQPKRRQRSTETNEKENNTKSSGNDASTAEAQEAEKEAAAYTPAGDDVASGTRDQKEAAEQSAEKVEKENEKTEEQKGEAQGQEQQKQQQQQQ